MRRVLSDAWARPSSGCGQREMALSVEGGGLAGSRTVGEETLRKNHRVCVLRRVTGAIGLKT